MAAARAAASAAAPACAASPARSCRCSTKKRPPALPNNGRITEGRPGEEKMRIHNLYADADGESHFRDIEVEWVQDLPGGKLSKRRPATGVIFRETAGDYDLDWHCAPRRQYIVNLDAGVEITASDGERRVI